MACVKFSKPETPVSFTMPPVCVSSSVVFSCGRHQQTARTHSQLGGHLFAEPHGEGAYVGVSLCMHGFVCAGMVHMSMHVSDCAYTCHNVCMCTHDACIHSCLIACVCVSICPCMCICVHVHIQAYICYICIFTCQSACVCTCQCAFICAYMCVQCQNLCVYMCAHTRFQAFVHSHVTMYMCVCLGVHARMHVCVNL